MRRLLTAATLAVCLALVAAASASPSGAAGPFTERFSGQPSSPSPWRPSNWDVTVHSRDDSERYQLEPMEANHGHDCAGPPATHTVSTYDDAVFLCRDHVMTSINASAYGLIYLTPPHLVDFSAGEAVVRFDMSTLRTADRDWVDIWISPFSDEVQLALQSFYPDLNGPPRRGIHVYMSTFNGQTNFKAEVYRGFQGTDLPSDQGLTFETFMTPDPARRDTFELRISGSKLVFGMPGYNQWWVDTNHGGLDWSRGVVQFGHHSYTPTKDCSGCTPNTWHWDNVSINPSVPFTILRANRRFVDPSTPASVSFPNAAPDGASLRFAGIGENIQVSFNGGSSWTKAQLQAQEKVGAEEHYTSYRTPVPAGATSVQFRADDWFAGEWMVRDISIWSLSAAGAATPPAPAVASPATSPPPAAEPEGEAERGEGDSEESKAPHSSGTHGDAAAPTSGASGESGASGTSVADASAATTTVETATPTSTSEGTSDEVAAPTPAAADLCVAGACAEESGGSTAALAWVLAAAVAFVGLGGAGVVRRRAIRSAAAAAAATTVGADGVEASGVDAEAPSAAAPPEHPFP